MSPHSTLHARYLHGRGADYLFYVKDNQPKLFDALDVLAWKDVPVSHAATGRGHGRVEQRTLQVMPAPPDLPFPHVSQVFLIGRAATDLGGAPQSNVAILGVTSLNAQRGNPTLIAEAARGQWSIESLHWIRDSVTAKTTPPHAPDPDPESWPRSATWPSEPSDYPDTATSLKPHGGPPAA